MRFTAHVTIMPIKNLLDPQGKAVLGGLANLGLTGIKEVRVGKQITLEIEAPSAAEAKVLAQEATQKVLCNQVMEQYEIQLD